MNAFKIYFPPNPIQIAWLALNKQNSSYKEYTGVSF